jgi:guanylate kinase
MEIRIKEARKEMEQSSHFDYQLENVNLAETVEKLKKIIEEYIEKV